MRTLLLLVLVIIVLLAAAYAQYRMPFHTATATQCWIARLVLVAVGLAAGYVAAIRAVPEGSLTTLLAFLGGFGVVHIPAAFILFAKRQRDAI